MYMHINYMCTRYLEIMYSEQDLQQFCCACFMKLCCKSKVRGGYENWHTCEECVSVW